MKHIVFFINTLSSGGAEHQLVFLANGLVDKGYDVTITTFGEDEDYYSYNQKVHRVRLAPQKSSGLKLLSIWWYFAKVKANCVIIFGQRESRLCMPALMFRRSKNLKVICGERNTSFGKPSRQERAVMNLWYRRANYIVPNSRSQYDYIRGLYPHLSDKTFVITNYTDLSIYQANPLPAGDVIRIGVFGRYNSQKNCLRFVDAVAEVVKRTNVPFTIDWYGNRQIKDGANPMYEQMREKVEKYGIQDYLSLNNHIKNVAEVMAQFDAMCLPSLWEGFSNSLSEAICCGRPVIASNVADNSVMVHDDENGFLFNPKDTEAMASAILKFLSLSNEERQIMGTASRKIAERLFDYSRFVSQYINLIEA